MSDEKKKMDDLKEYPFLDKVNFPSDFRLLNEQDLTQLAADVREYLIDSVAETGGHLAAGLGVVELTIALHYVFNTPYDRLVWDVGHQAYPHKILTGRKHQMSSLRQWQGLSGFLRRVESSFDSFGAGHASTSISATVGMAAAARQANEPRKAIAVIGDAAMGGGMALEALNHAGDLNLDMLVILNDNEMSISNAVGAMSNYLAKVLSSEFYHSVREGGKSMLSHMPHLSGFVGRWEEHMKGMVLPGTLFEEFGFNYIGPVDGHDFPTLIATLRNMKKISGPMLLHVVTRKGKGFKPAEEDPCCYHGVVPFDKSTGQMQKKKALPSYTQIFGQWACDLAAKDRRLVMITPAMKEGSGLVEFAEKFPSRYFDVGIAEEHAMTFSAGLACENFKPVLAIYSTFLQRAFDQLIHDVALQNLDVTLAVDRAGFVGADGATHAGNFDLSFTRMIPNIVVMAPADERECRWMLQTAYEYKGPAVVRYPRGCGAGVSVEDNLACLVVGEAEIRRQGQSIAILAFGSCVDLGLKLADQLNATLVNMRFIKPLDEKCLMALIQTHQYFVSIEENQIAGGAGSAVNEFFVSQGQVIAMLHLGLSDMFVEQGQVDQQLAEVGLDETGALARIQAFIA